MDTLRKLKKHLKRFNAGFIFKQRNMTVTATSSQQLIFTWVDSMNQPCPVEIAVDWLCSSTHLPGDSRVGLNIKILPQSFSISSSPEDLINTFKQLNNKLTKMVFDVIKTLYGHRWYKRNQK